MHISSLKWGQKRLTWWPGLLAPYSSVYGFGATFCFLNSVKPIAFDEFLSQQIGSVLPKDERVIHLLEFPFDRAEIADATARALGEPASVVRTMSLANAVPLARFEEVNLLVRQSCKFFYRAGEVKFCTTCWTQSCYHSIFHTLQGVNYCLIHGEELDEFSGLRVSRCNSSWSADLKRVESLYQSLIADSRIVFKRLSRGRAVIGTEIFAKYCKAVRAIPPPHNRELYTSHSDSRGEFWEKHKASVYFNAAGRVDKTVAAVLGESPFIGGKRSLIFKLTEKQRTLTLAAFKELGFERLMAMAWTTQILAGYDHRFSISDDLFFGILSQFTDIKDSDMNPQSLRDYTVELLSNACRKILYDGLAGHVTPSGHGLVLDAYRFFGELLCKMRIMRPEAFFVSFKRTAYSPAMPRGDAFGLEIFKNTSLLKKELEIIGYQFNGPWDALFNNLLGYVAVCYLIERSHWKSSSDYWEFKPSWRITLDEGNEMNLTVYWGKLPSTVLKNILSAWFANSQYKSFWSVS